MESIATTAHSQHRTNIVLMVEPACFGYNEQTAQSNSFMHPSALDAKTIQEQALKEFQGFVQALEAAGIELLVFRDSPTPPTPDSIFPNNWFSTHQSGRIILYPMATPNRRSERRSDIVETLQHRFGYRELLNLSYFEEASMFLEGTGSMVLDRSNHIAYAALSLRCQEEVLEEFSRRTGYSICSFHTMLNAEIPVYHTNVVMSVGERIAVVCFEVIATETERTAVRQSLQSTGHQILSISLEQMNSFAGNMLNLINKEGKSVWVMSTAAYQSLSAEQLHLLEQDGTLVHSPLRTIESVGGGSARCMIAEIFAVTHGAA